MTSFGRTRKTTHRILGCGALIVTLVASAAGAQVSAAEPAPPTRNQQAWQNEIAQVPQPSKGCFTADFPDTRWQEVPCTATPPYPQPPRRGPRPQVVGDGNDVAARVPSGFISNAIGSFDKVTNVTSESGPIGNTGPSIPNAYTLQLNTNFFTSTACAASPNPGCLGWQQFVYENYGTGGRAYIQYWLIEYNTTCPAGAGWNQFSFTGFPEIYCYKNNSLGAVPVPNQPITNLKNLSLSGVATAGGDSVTMFVGGTAYSKAGDNAVNAAAGWNVAEFNVFGDGGNSAGGGMATFNAGASLTVRTRVVYGGTAAPICVAQGFTAETNNLSFGTPAPTPTQPGPAMMFVESTVGGATANCAAAVTIGDPHLHTFAGLMYDFQASGDFVLAQVGSDFEVQARQVSSAPTWPNASVNQAVATRMGDTRVAVCGGPSLVVDGRPVDLRAGGTVSLSSGVDVSRIGDTYVITDESGNSVRAVAHAGYMDVSTGLGTWPTAVRGLLGNPDGDVRRLEASDGTQFSVPLSFDDLYYRYGDSWRVAPADSLLSPCGDKVEVGNPTKPFLADDLAPEIRQRAREICIRAEVTQALLDACTLDVAVLGEKAAAAYVGAKAPVLDGNRR
jgi:hypothetical protein